MVGVVPARRGLEAVAADLEAQLLQRLQDLLELRAEPVVRDGFAERRQVRAVRLVEAGAGADAAGRDLDVPTRRLADPDERALVGLVRRLVLREPDVAVGTEDLG